MSNLTDFIGSGGSGYPLSINHVYITASETYIAPYTGDYIVACCGGGGGGGASTDDYGAAGGGASGLMHKIVTLTKGEEVSVTIGDGGNYGSGSTDGAAGGTTSFGSYLSVSGGGGGTSEANGNTAGGNTGLYAGSGGRGQGMNYGGSSIVSPLYNSILLIAETHYEGGSYGSGDSSNPERVGAGGGSSTFGRGGHGGAADGYGTTTGYDGEGYGAGGGGGGIKSNHGGNGANGICIVMEKV